MEEDKELVNLQYEVYKLTGWLDESGDSPYTTLTSDYLLEKLSPFAHMNQNQVSVFSSGNNSRFDDWSAVLVENWADEDEQPRHKRTAESHADTPLKALLKLTIALHEEKELT